MGPYYDHATLQMRAFARANRGRGGSRTFSSNRSPRPGPGPGKDAGGLAGGALALPGLALACLVVSLASKLIVSDVWLDLCWRALFGASIVVVAAAVSSLPLLVAG